MKNIWQSSVGHLQVKKVLEKHFESGKVANAYLFFGVSGLGKSVVAKEFADALGGRVYSHDAVNSNVEDFRNFLSLASFKSSAFEVILIDNAELLSLSSSSLLLKALEDSKFGKVFILISSADKLPDTIVSRCVTLRFGKLNVEDMEILAKRVGLTVKGDILASLGNPGRMMSLFDSGERVPNALLSGFEGSQKTHRLLSALKFADMESSDIIQVIQDAVITLRAGFLNSPEQNIKRISLSLKALESLRGNLNKKFILEELALAW